MVYEFFDKKNSGRDIKNENIKNKELPEELHKLIIWKIKKRKVHSPFIDNIWGADLTYMQLISKFNKGFRFFMCKWHIYSKYAWVVPLKDKKVISITNAFQEILKESNRKPNRIRVDKSSKVYNRVMKAWLEKNDIDMYSTHNEERSVIESVIEF